MQKLMLFCNAAYFSCALSLVRWAFGMAILMENAFKLVLKISFWIFFYARVKPMKKIEKMKILFSASFRRLLLVFWRRTLSQLVLGGRKGFKRDTLHVSLRVLCAGFLCFAQMLPSVPRFWGCRMLSIFFPRHPQSAPQSAVHILKKKL